jgi:pimeloyl-ACP methyl ester carboxylesterase
MLSRMVPRTELRVIDGAGHMLAETHADTLVAQIESWLEATGRSAGTGGRQ